MGEADSRAISPDDSADGFCGELAGPDYIETDELRLVDVLDSVGWTLSGKTPVL